MTKLQKTLITATIVVAGVATPLFIQHQAQVKLREENQSLRQEVEQLAQLQGENQRLSNLVVQANSSQFPSNELLRLRGEVGLLRRQNAELAAQKSSVGQSDTVSKPTTKTPPAETEPFRSQVHTPVDFGQTLITGGWSTAPGQRMLVFVKPEAGHTAAGAQTITLRSTGIEIPESLLGAHGLTTLASEARQTVQHGQLSASADADALLRELARAANSQPSTLPTITTFPGQSAEIQVGNSTGGRMNLTAIPNLATDGKGFDLQLDAVLNASVQGK